MAQKFLFFISLFFVSFLSAQKLIAEIPVLENEKQITNLSGKINDSTSFHLIISKNKDSQKFETKPIFISGLETIQLENIITETKPLSASEPEAIQLDNPITKTKPIFLPGSKVFQLMNIITDTEPSFLTFHVNNEVLTITKALERGYMLYDLDYRTKTVKSNMLKVIANKIYSHGNFSFFFRFANRRLEIHRVIDSENTVSNSYTAENKEVFKFFTDLDEGYDVEFINDKVYFEKGSIKDIRGFFYGNILSFIEDDKKTGSVKLAQFFEDNTYTIKNIDLGFGKARKQNSFIRDNYLFAFCMEGDDAKLIVYDIMKSEIIKELKYNTNDFGEYSKVVINGEDKTTDFNSKRFFRSYYPQAVGSMYNPELYVGVNKSATDDYILEIGHVDKNTFKNKSTGNYWWTNNAFGSQFNGTDHYDFRLGSYTISGLQMSIWNALAEYRRRGNYFNLVLDDKFNVKKDGLDYEYYFLDDETYDSRLKNLYKLKDHFYIVMKNSVRVINYDKAENKYNIFELSKI